MAKILYVEDSEQYQVLVRRSLENFEITIAETAEIALEQFRNGDFDLILLDMKLPHKDGFSFLAELQAELQNRNTPVICLTGKVAVSDKVAAFDLGAVDYLTKPFDPAELVARVKSKLKKGSSSVSDVIEYGPITLDQGRHRVFLAPQSSTKKAGEALLTQTEFKLLAALASKPEEGLTRDQLLIAAWGEDARVLDRVVDTHVCSMRKKLLDHGKMIQSIPGVGYKLTRHPAKTRKAG